MPARAPPASSEMHRVRLDQPGRAVEEDGARVAAVAARHVAVVGAGGHHQQRVDAPAQERGDQLVLPLRVLAGRGGDEQQAAVARRGLDGLGDRGVERVGDVLDDQPERPRRVPVAE